MDPKRAPWTIPVTRTAVTSATGDSVTDLGDYSTRTVADLDNALIDMRCEPGGPNYGVAVTVASP